ncbi:uncharacterized protein LOC119573275 isoform X1 [Penaeus monodon]|uniref:uncharacterized protein LOC119573275 isoform X1 n=1 Tax=Penaeus monodon TaxID=6687 RepID=UPI0018A77DBD|nr:uncharacterized protein LOC119573275 isoform X1 [Penaeus monodon]
MPHSCSVVGCNNWDRPKDALFHRFPKEEETRKEWIVLCGKKKVNFVTERICSIHFEKTDYERKLKYEMLNLPVPRRLRTLKKDAIPSKHIPKVKDDDQPSEDENTEAAKRKQHLSQKETESKKEKPPSCKKRKVFRETEQENVFVVDGIDTGTQDRACKKEVSSQVEVGDTDPLGESASIKQESIDCEEGEDRLSSPSSENKDLNFSKILQVKEEVTIKEEHIEVFDYTDWV